MAVDTLFTGAAERWRQRIAERREYAVARDGNVFAAGLAQSVVARSEYDEARRLHDTLVAAHRRATLADLFPGKEEENAAGTVYAVTSRTPLAAPQPDPAAARRALCADLTLVPGIGPRTQAALHARGYRSLHDLLHHPRFRSGARAVLDSLADTDVPALIRTVKHRSSASHPLVLATAAFFRNHELVFLDIETLGLCTRPVILIGIGRLSGSDVVVTQYLVRHASEEAAAVLAAFAHLEEERAALVTFNGKAFDMPFLAGRAAYYGYPPAPAVPHYDVLHFARRSWGRSVPDCRLKTLETAFCGVRRSDDIPSAMVPEFFETYLRTGNPGPLVPVVEHNRIDVVSLARLFLLLRGGP
ncbi:MAG: exonuclease [Methanomicrobiales archaeon]|nr:exonuclease [Methanomicrobiales archaeon]